VARGCGAWVTWADGHTECVATARLLRHVHCARSLVLHCERAGRRAIEARQTEERLRRPELWAGAAILGARCSCRSRAAPAAMMHCTARSSLPLGSLCWALPSRRTIELRAPYAAFYPAGVPA
jgi:hypothetical protein